MKVLLSVSAQLLIASQLLVESNASLRGRALGLFAENFALSSQSVEDERDDSDSMQTRIIGGSVSKQGRYSYAVSLQDGIGHFCGKLLCQLLT
jgi:hypothetical protein